MQHVVSVKFQQWCKEIQEMCLDISEPARLYRYMQEVNHIEQQMKQSQKCLASKQEREKFSTIRCSLII